MTTKQEKLITRLQDACNKYFNTPVNIDFSEMKIFAYHDEYTLNNLVHALPRDIEKHIKKHENFANKIVKLKIETYDDGSWVRIDLIDKK